MAQCICVPICVHVSLCTRSAYQGVGHQAAIVYQKNGVWGESYFDSNHNASSHRLSSPESTSKQSALGACQKESYTTHPYKPIPFGKETLPHCTYTSPHRRTYLIYKH